MKLYRVSQHGVVYADYFNTKPEAHEHAKTLAPREEVTVSLIDVATGKEAILALLNEGVPVASVIKSWTLTQRGALLEDEE